MKIAVILISFNQESYITAALDGIRLQTRAPDEVIIADDGSTDNTQQLILNYVKLHELENNWTLLLSKENRGVNTNLQNALDQTTSDIIIGMAGDDISLPERCRLTENLFLNHLNAQALLFSGMKINFRGEVIGEILEMEGVLLCDPLPIARRGYSGILPVGLSFRREIFFAYGSLPTDVPNEDDQTIYRAILHGGILTSSYKVYKYRIHENSASSWVRDENLKKYIEKQENNWVVRLLHHQYWLKLTNDSQHINKSKIIDVLGRRIRALDIYINSKDGISLIKNFNLILSALTFKEIASIVLGPKMYFFLRKLRNYFLKR